MFKTIITHFLSFTLCLLIVLISIILTFKKTILNEEFLLTTLENNNYYEEVYSNIYINFENNLLSSGLDSSLIIKLLSQEKITTTIKELIINFYHGQKSTIDTTYLKNNFRQIIDEFTLNKNLSKEEKESINLLEQNLTTIYEEEISYSLTSLNNISTILPIIQNLCNISLIIISLIALNLIAIIICILKNKTLVGTSFLASGTILIIIKFILNNHYQDIFIINKIFSQIIVSVFTSIIAHLFISGLILFVIGLIIIIFSVIKDRTTSRLEI